MDPQPESLLTSCFAKIDLQFMLPIQFSQLRLNKYKTNVLD